MVSVFGLGSILTTQSACWICHRDSEDLKSVLGKETAEVRLARDRLSRAREHEEMFTRSSSMWARKLPSYFSDMELTFVLDNSKQFERSPLLDDLSGTRQILLQLGSLKEEIQSGSDAKLGDMTIEKNDDNRARVVSRLMQFESKTGRILPIRTDDQQGSKVVDGLDGLTTADALSYLEAAGKLYFALITAIAEESFARMTSRLPQSTLNEVRIPFGSIWLCAVCTTLFEVPVPAAASGVPAAGAKEAVALKVWDRNPWSKSN